jgi:putative lipoprotein (rSAM/lipoprotein system)
MKNPTLFLYKNYNKLLRILLSLLGFGAVCSLGSCMYGSPAVEYGTPYATFKVNGNVKAEATSEVLPNIRVVMGNDTTFTDGSGNYRVSNEEFAGSQAFLLEFKDVNGETGGEYHALDTIVEFIDPEFTGGLDTWDRGTTEKELNVKLKNKE